MVASPGSIAPGSTANGPRKPRSPIRAARRGQLFGNGVRFGFVTDVLAAGEGIETMLALKSVLPDLPMIAALSANHLAALDLSSLLTRLYVARDRDAAGQMAAARLHARGHEAGIEVLRPHPGWRRFQCRSVPARRRRHARAMLAHQLAPDDVLRFVRRHDAA